MTGTVLVDVTVLHSFARIGRLELLELLLGGKGRWTEAVAYEADTLFRSLNVSGHVPMERWLGEPIEIDAAQDMNQVEHLRRSVLGGTTAEPLQYLGTAQSLHLLQSDPGFTGARWLNDDAASVDLARRQGLSVGETPDLLREGVAVGDLTADVVVGVYRAMTENDHAILRDIEGRSGGQAGLGQAVNDLRAERPVK